jgi:hypothetical protein
MQARTETPWRLDLTILPIILLLGFVAGLLEAARSPDPAMVIQGWTFAACMAATGVWYMWMYAGRDPHDERGPYSDAVIKAGVVASMFWAIAGMAVGLLIALQLSFPTLFYFPDLPWTSFGRLRPLHTSAVIFAFGGNVLIATSFYVVQRTCKARLFGGSLPWFVLWGYNIFVLLAGTGYLLGITQSREYAEPEWYADIWLTLVWVCYLLTFFGAIWKRKERHIYVANWFYLSFIVTIAVLHIVNNLSMPVSLLGSKSYSLFSGVQDALIQWWYGHNAVGFFLTAGFLGIVYYFIPKRASLFLSAVHHPFLEPDLYLYLGGTAPPALHRVAGMGPDAGNDFLHHSVDAQLGWNDQRSDDPVGGVGQASHRSRSSDAGGLGGFLRHGHLRGASDVDQDGQRTLALHQLDDRACPFWRSGLGGLCEFWRALLPRAMALEKKALFQRPGGMAFLDFDAWHRALHHRAVGRGHYARPDVARL